MSRHAKTRAMAPGRSETHGGPETSGVRLGGRPACPRTGGAGFTLTELLVALVILEIGLLGALGLGTLAAREVARAAELQRALGALEVVADSLLAVDAAPSGSRVVGSFLVRWEPSAGGTRLLVERAGGTATPLTAVELEAGG